jgi:hypothetical protein
MAAKGQVVCPPERVPDLYATIKTTTGYAHTGRKPAYTKDAILLTMGIVKLTAGYLPDLHCVISIIAA